MMRPLAIVIYGWMLVRTALCQGVRLGFSCQWDKDLERGVQLSYSGQWCNECTCVHGSWWCTDKPDCRPAVDYALSCSNFMKYLHMQPEYCTRKYEAIDDCKRVGDTFWRNNLPCKCTSGALICNAVNPSILNIPTETLEERARQLCTQRGSSVDPFLRDGIFGGCFCSGDNTRIICPYNHDKNILPARYVPGFYRINVRAHHKYRMPRY